MLYSAAPLPDPKRRVFCNRTLNLRAMAAIGFDMDYTLIHYHVERWERRAYEHARHRLVTLGLGVGHLEFDPELANIGLIVDAELGNLVKANRFGFVKRACHGVKMLEFEAQRTAYEMTVVDLADKRWVFVNTLFGLSEACLYMQLVDLADEGKLDGTVASGKGYTKLYDLVRKALDATHLEGELKAEIVADPDRFVALDPELPLALQDLRHAGKKLCVITNSEWSYTRAMMSHAFDRFLEPGKDWRSLFDLVIVSARKPAFFTERMPAFEVIDLEGRLLPRTGKLEPGKCYLGGHARLVEESLGISGDDFLYVGDHIFADVNASKSSSRWRTALILRELEGELAALESFKPAQQELTKLMKQKEQLEHRYSLMRLAVQRIEKGYGPRVEGVEVGRLRADMRELRAELVAIDDRLAPLARQAGELSHERWGLLLRTGNDKSHLARQIERHADVYTSRVSNLLHSTPFVYLRSPRQSLPHDSGPEGGVE